MYVSPLVELIPTVKPSSVSSSVGRSNQTYCPVLRQRQGRLFLLTASSPTMAVHTGVSDESGSPLIRVREFQGLSWIIREEQILALEEARITIDTIFQDHREVSVGVERGGRRDPVIVIPVFPIDAKDRFCLPLSATDWSEYKSL